MLCPPPGANGTQEDLQNGLGENSLVIEFSCRFCAAESRMYTAATAAKHRPDLRGVFNPIASREQAPGMENSLQMHVKNEI